MKKIGLDYSYGSVGQHEIDYLAPFIEVAHKMLHDKTGPGNDFLGWVDYPKTYPKDEFARIKTAAKKIQDSCDALIVIGIGGSYLGSKAAIEGLSHSFYNNMPKDKRKGPEIYFAGQNISGRYLKHLLEMLEGKDLCVNVISKSGTTTEPAIAFRFFKELLEEKYGKDGAKERIFATTDASKGALRELATQEGYETFVIADDIGGRYSVLTPVGLLPIAAAGIDIDDMMKGAEDAYEAFSTPSLEGNPCYQYVALRNALKNKGKDTEIYVNYEPSLHYISEWLKQLYGESEGKDQKGLFPASVDFSTDLHSMGQFVQDGNRNLFETVLNIEASEDDMILKANKENLDNLNYLEGKTMSFVNNKAFQGTLLAHVDGNVPNLVLNIPEMTPYYLGFLFYFFEKACGVSGYLLGVNPFDQPGVEAYKKNMFALLGKEGFEDLAKSLEERLQNL